MRCEKWMSGRRCGRLASWQLGPLSLCHQHAKSIEKTAQVCSPNIGAVSEKCYVRVPQGSSMRRREHLRVVK